MLNPKNLRGRIQWTASMIQKSKANIKADLDKIREQDGQGSALKHMMAQIREREERFDALSLLECVIYIISAIYHNSRHGGLPSSTEKRLAEMAYGILQVQGIRPGKSKLSTLYGDLHLALSQAMRSRGLHWRAAWEQNVGYALSRSAPSGGKAFQLYTFALRALRLGHGKIAMQNFRVAEELGLDKRALQIARLSKIKTLRLSGSLDKARHMLASPVRTFDVDSKFEKELRWEEMCIDVQATSNLGKMVRAVSKGGSHYEFIFLVEAFLWSLSLRSIRWTGSFPRINRLPRNQLLNVQTSDSLYLYAKVFEQCYDGEIPYVLRLKKLGDSLAKTHSLISIDCELLVLAAAARWLARNNSYQLACLVLERYRSLSHCMSSGKIDDALGILGDMFQKGWYQEGGVV